jgi:RNA-binding protein
MTAPALTGAQKSYLRSLGQTMGCSLVIGREGLKPAALADLNRQLESRELVKIKLLAEREERAVLATAIAAQTGATEAGAVGKTALFYRQQLDPKRRVIGLPAAKAAPAD